MTTTSIVAVAIQTISSQCRDHNDVYYQSRDQTLLPDTSQTNSTRRFRFDFDFQNTYPIPPLLFFKAGQPST